MMPGYWAGLWGQATKLGIWPYLVVTMTSCSIMAGVSGSGKVGCRASPEWPGMSRGLIRRLASRGALTHYVSRHDVHHRVGPPPVDRPGLGGPGADRDANRRECRERRVAQWVSVGRRGGSLAQRAEFIDDDLEPHGGDDDIGLHLREHDILSDRVNHLDWNNREGRGRRRRQYHDDRDNGHGRRQRFGRIPRWRWICLYRRRCDRNWILRQWQFRAVSAGRCA